MCVLSARGLTPLVSAPHREAMPPLPMHRRPTLPLRGPLTVSQQETPPPLAQHGQIPLDAEALAQQCLDSGRISSADLIQLINLLPSETPARAPQLPNKQNPDHFSFTTGAYVRAGILGLRGNTLSFPLANRVLTSYATNRVGDMPFTSVALFSDLEAPLHSGRNNAKGYDKLLIGISDPKAVSSG